MTTIKERIAAATERLGKARAEEILRKAQRNLRAGHFLTLAQQANHLETAIAEEGITAVWSGSRVPQKNPETYEEFMVAYDAIKDPAKKTAYFRENLAAMKAARVRALYPNAYVLKPRRRK